MAWTSIKPSLLQLESLLLASSSSFSSENFSTTATSSLPWEGRSASAECPPQTGFNAFAFLAFILIAIDTIMNINNNINNNNNNNNNNDRNNNNNNNFEAMNMNVRRSFQEDGFCMEVLYHSVTKQYSKYYFLRCWLESYSSVMAPLPGLPRSGTPLQVFFSSFSCFLELSFNFKVFEFNSFPIEYNMIDKFWVVIDSCFSSYTNPK